MAHSLNLVRRINLARRITIHNNQLIDSGYIVLLKSVDIKNRKYKKVWSPLWDVSINKDKYDVSEEEKKKANSWTWHGIVKDKVEFYTNGDNVTDFVPMSTAPKEKEIYVIKKVKR